MYLISVVKRNLYISGKPSNFAPKRYFNILGAHDTLGFGILMPSAIFGVARHEH